MQNGIKQKIDDAMLDGLGIKEMEKKQYIQLIHRTEKDGCILPSR